MSRKPKKGYYVQGVFIALGSELDLAYKRELKGTDAASKTDLKRESTERQKLGEDLLELRGDLKQRLLAQGHITTSLIEAVNEAKRITNFEGKRRQMQYVGKLMRRLGEADVQAIRESLEIQHGGSAKETMALHESEAWRKRLIEDDHALAEWLSKYPLQEPQQFRALVRQARKDATPLTRTEVSTGKAPRQGRAYRELFRWIRETLYPSSPGMPSPDEPIGMGEPMQGLATKELPDWAQDLSVEDAGVEHSYIEDTLVEDSFVEDHAPLLEPKSPASKSQTADTQEKNSTDQWPKDIPTKARSSAKATSKAAVKTPTKAAAKKAGLTANPKPAPKPAQKPAPTAPTATQKTIKTAIKTAIKTTAKTKSAQPLPTVAQPPAPRPTAKATRQNTPQPLAKPAVKSVRQAPSKKTTPKKPTAKKAPPQSPPSVKTQALKKS
jgi:ribosome-associated protein